MHPELGTGIGGPAVTNKDNLDHDTSLTIAAKLGRVFSTENTQLKQKLHERGFEVSQQEQRTREKPY